MTKLNQQKLPHGWREVKLGEIARITSGGTPNRKEPLYWNGNIPWITTSEIKFGTITSSQETISDLGLKKSSAKLFKPGTLLMAMYGQGVTRGKVAKLGIEATTNQACAAISPIQDDPNFLFYFLMKEYQNIRNLSNDGGQKNLSLGLIKTLKISMPPFEEQVKLVKIIETWDKYLEILRKIINKKILIRKSLFQRLILCEFRLPGFSSKWEYRYFKDILHEHKEKSTGSEEVYSVSVNKGLVNQIEHLGRSFSAKDTSNYNLVKYGDIVYTKSPTGDFPLGIIKQSKVNKNVIVSPLYGVFTPESFSLGVILDMFFRSPTNVKNYLSPIVQKGAKNTIAITNKTFLSRGLVLPSDKNEQMAIANILLSLDKEIDLLEKQFRLVTVQKKYLLNNLITGQIRVPEFASHN